MNIFQEVKSYVTARQAAEQYGIRVGRNQMACCPFHDDHHPSMKIDTNYYCFACGAKGDVIGLTAGLFGLSPYEAASKLIADFQLPLTAEKCQERRKKYALRSGQQTDRRFSAAVDSREVSGKTKKIQKQESGFCQREDDRLAPACSKSPDRLSVMDPVLETVLRIGTGRL